LVDFDKLLSRDCVKAIVDNIRYIREFFIARTMVVKHLLPRDRHEKSTKGSNGIRPLVPSFKRFSLRLAFLTETRHGYNSHMVTRETPAYSVQGSLTGDLGVT